MTIALPDHPELRGIVTFGKESVRMDGISAGIDAHGVEKVTAAMERLIAEVLTILGRLIGDDMAFRLMDHRIGVSPDRTPRGSP
jgi:hypothetical protein